jgi:hypothetical protein
MQGLPNRTSGVIVMRSRELMRQVYGTTWPPVNDIYCRGSQMLSSVTRCEVHAGDRFGTLATQG